MSSFKRKSSSKQPPLPTGTRPSPTSSLTVITSTGIPSLDDILGGGLPLSCSLLILNPDPHSAYGELVQKYFIAQGLVCGQKVCVIDDHANELALECMWTPGGADPPPDDEDEDAAPDQDDKITIAWRYKQMKKFQTTVSSSTPSAEEYCRPFDLTARIPHSVVESSRQTDQLVCLDVLGFHGPGEPITSRVIRKLAHMLEADAASSRPLRICIPSFGSPQWGDLGNKHLLHFIYSLRALLRKHPHACASLCLPSHLSTDAWGGAGWTQKLGWLSDAVITLAAFGANPSLSNAFPAHHGFLHIHTLPAPHTLVPPSDRYSTLRGLSSTGASAGGCGENNLAFRCTRKRLVFETLHLDLEGGVGERRTTPSANAIALDIGTSHAAATPAIATNPASGRDASTKDAALVQIALEGGVVDPDGPPTPARPREVTTGVKARKEKKKVAFRSDRPELYDF